MQRRAACDGREEEDGGVGSIFISYRRDDTAGYGGRLHEALCTHFGNHRVFRDIDAIQPGTDFARRIDEAVADAEVVVVLIGRDWLTIAGRTGRRRLDDPDDFVCLEIASALDRGVPVIPVTVEEAEVPAPSDLPEPIEALGRLQGIELSEERWRYDVGRLVSRLDEVVDTPAAPSMQEGPSPRTGTVPAIPRWKELRRLAVLIALVAVVSVVSVVANWLDPESKPRDAFSSETPLPASVEHVEINKSVWYSGFKLTLGRAALRTAGRSRVLDVPVMLENQGDNLVALDKAIYVTSNGRSAELDYDSDLPRVPGRAAGKGGLSFAVGSSFFLSDAVITLGKSDMAQAVVPLGSSGALEALQPLPVSFTTRTVTAGELSVEVRSGELRADDPRSDRYRQAARGHRILILDFASSSTTAESGTYYIRPANIVVKLPDGTTVAPETIDESATLAKPARDFHASYLVNVPVAGSYGLVVNDTRTTKKSASIQFKVG